MFQAATRSLTQPLLQKALESLQAGNPAGAETLLAGVLRTSPNDANALHMMGLVRLQQGRTAEALPLLEQAIRLNPRHALVHLNLGKALGQLGRDDDAIARLREALRLKPDLPEAQLELANAQIRAGRPEQAEKSLRAALKLAPDDARARAALGGVLIGLARHDEAELVLARALTQAADPALRATLHQYLGLAQRGLSRDTEAVENFGTALRLAPRLPGLEQQRVDALQAADRNAEALAALEGMLARAPGDGDLHYQYNSLLYRLGREADFLASFDRAPQSPEILVTKGRMQLAAKRGDGALETFSTLAARDPGDAAALSAKGIALSLLGRHDEAVAAIEAALALAPDHPDFLSHLAGALIVAGDAGRAAHYAQKAAALNPADQSSLGMLGTAWRMMGDARDEELMGYDHLIRSFEIAPPKSWTGIQDFNAELSAFLDSIHPTTGNHFDQTQRAGTKTGDLFSSRHPLIAGVREQIETAVGRYIDEMKGRKDHPLLRRRTGGFDFAGSWSSRLTDCGYHVDHIHPSGWISSCYYVAVPDAARDEREKQGWIKFGQPAARPELDWRRAVQPRPGLLVLFPSYMWHGTLPFRASTARTTIAFDVVPAG